jgi:flavin-binding protein dodecin
VGSFLVVANRTLGDAALWRHIDGVLAADPASTWFVLAPVAIPTVVSTDLGGVMGGIAGIDVQTHIYLQQEARERVDDLVRLLASKGVEAAGTTVLGDPLTQIQQLVRERQVDEIVVSMLPTRTSRWFRADLVRRIARRVDVPVVALTAPDTFGQAPGGSERQAETRESRHKVSESVYKIIELVGTSTESWEKAAAAAVTTAAQSLRDLRVAEIAELDLVIEDGAVTAYRAKIKVSFKYTPGTD